MLRGVDFFSPPLALRLLLALFAPAFSDCRAAACALLAFFVPVLAAPRLSLERLDSLADVTLPDLPEEGDLEEEEEEELRDAIACS